MWFQAARRTEPPQLFELLLSYGSDSMASWPERGQFRTFWMSGIPTKLSISQVCHGHSNSSVKIQRNYTVQCIWCLLDHRGPVKLLDPAALISSDTLRIDEGVQHDTQPGDCMLTQHHSHWHGVNDFFEDHLVSAQLSGAHRAVLLEMRQRWVVHLNECWKKTAWIFLIVIACIRNHSKKVNNRTLRPQKEQQQSRKKSLVARSVVFAQEAPQKQAIRSQRRKVYNPNAPHSLRFLNPWGFETPNPFIR